MAKRISRRELKEKIKDLTFELRTERYKLDTLKMEHRELKKRFEELGSKAESYDARGAGVECLEIVPEPWGQYCRMAPWKEFSEDDMEMLRNRLVSNIAKGLIERNLVQIIIHDHNDWIPDRNIIAAKLWVIPWDKMVKKLVIQK